MNIVVDINHPADVHLFKNFILKMKEKRHKILITATQKDVSIELLDNYGFDYINLGSYGCSIIKKIINIPIIDFKMYNTIKKFKPDIFVGFGSIRAAHVSRLIGKPCIAFEDTEHSILEHILYMPFTNVICTPSCYNKDLGKKQIRFNGYKELSYLHPNYFNPNLAVLDKVGLNKEDIYIILRLVSWEAPHDVGQYGVQNKVAMVEELEKYGRVFITSEGKIDKELERYKLEISPEKMHDFMNYASLYIGEGATMATESALMGIPSIYISSLVGTMGNLVELEQKYGLIYSYNDQNKAMKKAIELIQKPDLKEEWKKKKDKLLKDKIDVTEFMIWFIENYPKSHNESLHNN